MGNQKPVLDLSGLAVGSLEVTSADSLGSVASGRGMTELGTGCGWCGGCGGCGGCWYCGWYYMSDE
jgi:hypothetical protein